MKITPEVFVSSTWEDLNDCRSAILANFPRLDILYRGMELFGARTPLPKDAMLAEVRACDLFIGIVGHRYGSEDPGDLCSYTELEYREAMTCKIPVLIFLVDNKSVQIPPEHVEPDRKRRKLAAGRKSLRAIIPATNSPIQRNWRSESRVQFSDGWTTLVRGMRNSCLRATHFRKGTGDFFARYMQAMRLLLYRLVANSLVVQQPCGDSNTSMLC